MLRLLLAAIAMLLAGPVFAQDTRIDVKTVASLAVYERVCEKTEKTTAIIEALIQSAARDQNIEPEDVRAQATVMSNMLASLAGEGERRDRFCSQMKTNIAEAYSGSKPSLSKRILASKANIILDFAVIFVIGAAVGGAIGLGYKWRTNMNINATRYWIPAWGFGLIVLYRLLLALFN